MSLHFPQFSRWKANLMSIFGPVIHKILTWYFSHHGQRYGGSVLQRARPGYKTRQGAIEAFERPKNWLTAKVSKHLSKTG